jgi:hypothetical protein
MPAKNLPKIDITKLDPEEVDKMGHEALREAVRSVIRDPNLAASHRDHRSHSSVADRTIRDTVTTTRGKTGGQK